MYQLETRFARTIRYEYSLYVLQSRASRSRCSVPRISGRVDMLTSPVPATRAPSLLSTWYDLVRYMQAPNRLGDVGEARWLLSHRWTDTSPTLPDAAYDTRNQGRVVSHSELSLLSACVRLCQLREVHHSLQQSLNPWSRTQSAATDGSPSCCT